MRGNSRTSQSARAPMHRFMTMFTFLWALAACGGDYSNNRILAFDPFPTANNASASFVLGQPDFDTGNGECDADSLSRVEAMAVTLDGKMPAIDHDNNRVLIWNSSPAASFQSNRAHYSRLGGVMSCNGYRAHAMRLAGPRERRCRPRHLMQCNIFATFVADQ